MRYYFLPVLSVIVSATAVAQPHNKQQISHASLCGPIPSVCNPMSNNALSLGITYFKFGQINNASVSSPLGYQNFTCTDSTMLNQGDSYALQANTNQTYAEWVRVWIDFDNNGSFDTTELIFADQPTVYTHGGIVSIPVMGQVGIPLRLRVACEVDLYPPPDGCNNVEYGEYEDYTVYLNSPTAVDGKQDKITIAFFPTPFRSEAMLRIESIKSIEGSHELKIYNVLGMLVRTEKIEDLHAFVLQRRNLNEGLYFFEIADNQKRLASGKFIIE